ncbi:MAG: DUF3859 domain-containing protein [Rhodobacterales bacterium]|nr:DUF3859 domain-containing protein [Rhodobacterales bacterium]
MPLLVRHLLAVLFAAICATIVLAGPVPPFTASGISFAGLGVYCDEDDTQTEAAPGTSLGYVHILRNQPRIAFSQQEVPARLGVHFGVVVVSDRDIAVVRNETWKPGATRPEVWFTELAAKVPRARGFVFELEDELVTGIWRMDAFDGDLLLYSVEWEVKPASDLPGISSNCDLLS